MDNKNKHILQLIANYTAKDISVKELEELHNWISQDKKNKAIFNSYVSTYKNAKGAVFVEKVNTDNAWKTIVSKLDNTEEFLASSTVQKTNKFKPFIKYAVAASIVFIAGLLYVTSTKNTVKDAPSIVVNDVIFPGTDKAVLTLANGTSIPLEKGKKINKPNLKSNGEELVYSEASSSSSSSSKEIAFNYLTVPRGGQFSIQLADGTKVWLNSDSKLKYPESFAEGEPRSVELLYGEAYFDVSPSTAHKGTKFNVLHKYQNIEVLGTEFNVKAYTDDANLFTTLVEGKVALQKKGYSSYLTPGYQSITNINEGFTIQKVDVAAEVSWRKGLFTFKRESLKEIMKTLSRWYNVDVVIVNKELENIEFKGVFRKNQTIEEILTLIQNTNFINQFKIEGKTVFIN
ncbi:anti-FecI sigma factor FecR [Cellulophaga geojensis KL-A]|uniref:Anti-FecI sigma factor FecR n=1 Tax=Cellulophaga geojensis KL-A TaxID=1328323 RepID=A0ABP3BBS5_9FLAO|nr:MULTISPECIES: FecR domain-containing protein [Cellulophaga]APU11135.1 hypothetical protein A5M85_12850 [Cellulophaga lytica]EWH14427.1 anti-FecI sigma factor FecR [Cellulophaga geojensis KL-A]